MTGKEIKKLYEFFKVPENIIRHMFKVKEVAEILAQKFLNKGIKVDIEAISKAALLHDCMRLEKDHALKMTKFLQKLGERKLARLVLMHDFFNVDRLKTWDEKIIYYADKRVAHDKVVSLHDRFEDGRKRNFKDNKNIEEVLRTEKKAQALEKEITKILGKPLI